MSLLGEPARVQASSVDDDLNSLLVESLDGLAQAVPCSRDPTGVLPIAVCLGVIRNVNLWNEA